tara:strand:+ start:780 stop:2468 length:1689 start_codon:yes stop_codon:yes gene_type:complete
MTRYIRINSTDEVLAAHVKYVDSLHKYQFNTAVVDLEETDISALTDATKFKKGDFIAGLWQLLEDNNLKDRLTALMARHLANEVDPSEHSGQGVYSGDDFTKGDMLKLLANAGLSYDEWMTQYESAGKARMQANEQAALEKAEKAALEKTNIEKAESHFEGMTFSLPAIAGKMGENVYYTVMVPFSQLRKIFTYNETELPVELRIQRQLNKARASGIADYIRTRKNDFVLPALTASVSEYMQFEPVPGFNNVGHVKIPIDAKLVLNDGQHREAGIFEAIERDKTLGNNMVSIEMFYDQGLERSQQMFADINNNSVKPSKSLSILFDKQNRFNTLVIEAVKAAGLNHIIEYERASPGKQSAKIWGISGLKKAASVVLGINDKTISDYSDDDILSMKTLLQSWLNKLKTAIPGFAALVEDNQSETVAQAREDLISTHTAFLHVLASVTKVYLADFYAKRRQYLDDRGPVSIYESRKMMGLAKTVYEMPELPTLDKLDGIAKLDMRKDSSFWYGRIVNPDGTMNPKPNGISLGAWAVCHKLGIMPSDELDSLNHEVFGELLKDAG